MPETMDLSRFKLGIKEIDAQHAKFFKMVENLAGHAENGDPADWVQKALDQMVDYVDLHFETEMNLMVAGEYPWLEDHQKEHAFFVRKLMEFNQAFRSGQGDLDLEMLEFLRNWFANHILGTDALYVKFLKEN